MAFIKGQSGNPKGRPKGSFSLKTRVIKYLEEHPEEMGSVVKSLACDPKYRSLLFKMIDGTPKQQVAIEQEQLPIPILSYLKQANDSDVE